MRSSPVHHQPYESYLRAFISTHSLRYNICKQQQYKLKRTPSLHTQLLDTFHHEVHTRHIHCHRRRRVRHQRRRRPRQETVHRQRRLLLHQHRRHKEALLRRARLQQQAPAQHQHLRAGAEPLVDGQARPRGAPEEGRGAGGPPAAGDASDSRQRAEMGLKH
ncbi:hypothetical protein CCHR01_14601 [Colletotrichum chrysophilum]|uniref:Uncharacterized protein n=1 Tax=Colletotrichum chrysophilum TaxID=1836956 RepID=A0AAD9A986_9PEZI|nr:hypothetical protein CCHR01_14601 [Colletotrichum chrysophilum]